VVDARGREARVQHTVDTEVSACPEYVWAVLADVARWPDWTSAVRSVVPLDGGPLVIGGGVRIDASRLPVRTWRVAAVVPRRSFTWTNEGFGSRGRLHVTCEAADTGTRLRFTVERTGPCAAALDLATGSASAGHLEALVDGLRRRCEGRRPAGRRDSRAAS
jgi:uncharacterized protein YndB with AHSA1/START domain